MQASFLAIRALKVLLPADSKMTYNLLSTLSSSSEPGGISIVMSGLFGLDDRAMSDL